MRDLQQCVRILEDHGRLIRVTSEVDVRHEMAGIAKRFEGREALLFERPKGFAFPLLIGMMWSRANLALVFGTTPLELPFLIGRAFAEWAARSAEDAVQPLIVPNAPAQEVRMETPDLDLLPTPTYALGDGGPYLSNCVVVANDPETGVRNASIHRFMITSPDTLGMLMDAGRHLRDYYERAEKMGKPLEITINNGVDPAVLIAALSPAAAAPIDRDELGIASVLLGQPVRLCQSLSVTPPGIADAQFILEAEIVPRERAPEGPFGEVTGYYGPRDDRWVVRVKTVTRREHPLVQGLLPGVEVFNCVGLTAEAALFNTLSKEIPGLKNVHMTHSSGFYSAVVQMDPRAPGFGKQAILAAFAAFPPLQVVTVVNSDVDIFNETDVQWALATRFDPEADLVIVKNAYGHELNPMTKNGLVNKIGFDCTCPVPTPPRFERVSFQEVDLGRHAFEKKTPARG